MSHIDGYTVMLSTGRNDSYNSGGERDRVILNDVSLSIKDFIRKKHSIHIMDSNGRLAFILEYEAIPAQLANIAHQVMVKLKEII